MGRALGTIYRAIATHISKKAGHTKTTAHTGAVTLIQRFGGAINLNVHLHMLLLDGAYVDNVNGGFGRWAQPVDATHALNRSAGVSYSNVFRGRSFNCRATALSLA